MMPARLLLVAATIALAIALASASMPALGDSEPAVTAIGEGLVEAAPDIAWLRFGVTARQPTVAAARDDVAAGVARLIALAREAGIRDEHIATAALSVNPDYEWHPETRQRVLQGYVVSRQVTLRLGELGKLGDLTERALALGVTDASPAIFDSSRRKELEAEALAAATRDARARAEVMAGALGMTLGAPLRISAVDAAGIPRPMVRMAADQESMGGAETYQPGLLRVTAQVSASFAWGLSR